jgi:hypothetical protein
MVLKADAASARISLVSFGEYFHYIYLNNEK